LLNVIAVIFQFFERVAGWFWGFAEATGNDNFSCGRQTQMLALRNPPVMQASGILRFAHGLPNHLKRSSGR